MELKAELGKVIAAARTNEEVLARAAACIRSVCKIRWVGLYRINHAQAIVENLVFEGGPAPVYPIFPANQGLTGLSLLRKKSVIVHDIKDDLDYLATLPDTRTEGIIPVLDGDVVVGTIDIESPEPYSLTAEMVEALESCSTALVPFMKDEDPAHLSPVPRPAATHDMRPIPNRNIHLSRLSQSCANGPGQVID